MVWLPGRGTDALSPPPVESTDEVKDEAKEPSAALGGCGSTVLQADAASVPSASFFIVVR